MRKIKEIKFAIGGRQNGQNIYNAIKLLEYINNLPTNKMYGIQRFTKGVTILTKNEVIPKRKIEEQIKKLESDGYWDFYENVDLEKTINILKQLLEE